jgi:hypothetical protein
MIADAWTFVYYLQHRNSEEPCPRRLSELVMALAQTDNADADKSIALCLEGRELAEQCGEAWWILYFEYRRVHTLQRQHNIQAARDAVLSALVEARKPQYTECPQRICLHEAAIWIYMDIDPIGYSPQIREAMAYMDREIPPDLSCRFCHSALEIAFHYERDEYAEAEALALRYLEATQNQLHYQSTALLFLCAINAARGNWSSILEWAREAEVQTRRNQIEHDEATSIAWQAAALRRAGHTEEARQAYRNAEAKAAALPTMPTGYYYSAVCAYHEQQGEYAEMLELRRRQRTQLQSTDLLKRRCDVQLAICRLQQQLGQDWQPAADELRSLARQMIDPSRFYAQLAELESTRER